MKARLPLPCLTLLLALPFAAGCETEDPTYAVVDNDYAGIAPGADPAMQTVVYKVWWNESLFTAPLAGASESERVRVVSANDFAYVLLAPGWDPASTTPPALLLPARTRERISVTRGDTLHIRLSDATVIGNCAAAASGPLTQSDADLITQRIFPGEFANGFFDASTCAFRVPVDTGDAGATRD